MGNSYTDWLENSLEDWIKTRRLHPIYHCDLSNNLQEMYEAVINKQTFDLIYNNNNMTELTTLEKLEKEQEDLKTSFDEKMESMKEQIEKLKEEEKKEEEVIWNKDGMYIGDFSDRVEFYRIGYSGHITYESERLVRPHKFVFNTKENAQRWLDKQDAIKKIWIWWYKNDGVGGNYCIIYGTGIDDLIPYNCNINGLPAFRDNTRSRNAIKELKEEYLLLLKPTK